MHKDVRDLSDEEFARHGNEVFEKRVLPQIDHPETKARHFVVIDIETGDFEMSDSERPSLDATHRLLERRPEARGRLWKRRIGSSTAYRAGIRSRSAEEKTR